MISFDFQIEVWQKEEIWQTGASIFLHAKGSCHALVAR
jgi:hypothetical protein